MYFLLIKVKTAPLREAVSVLLFVTAGEISRVDYVIVSTIGDREIILGDFYYPPSSKKKRGERFWRIRTNRITLKASTSLFSRGRF
jgi:hypothetical protein